MSPQALVRFYPRSWRERYGTEMLALLEQSGAHGWRVTSDLVRGCVGAWLMAPFDGQQPPSWLIALFVIAGWAGGLILLALLTVWLKPAPIAWRAWIAAAAVLLMMVRLFTKKFEAGRSAPGPELAAFEVFVFVVLTLVAGTLLHKPAPAGGLATARDWLFFILDPSRLGLPHAWLILAIIRLVWPRGYAIEEQTRRSPTSTLGLSG